MKYETLNNTDLRNYLKELKSRGADNTATYEVEQYLRITYPFAIVILTLIGVILSARKSREGAGFQIAMGFVLAFIYIIFYITSRTIAQAGSMNPLLACWLPNIVFTFIGLGLYKSVPK
jgi:lipopolysaccharide export system permease protein